MKILYKSLFRGWIEITEEQKERLIKHMIKAITALSGNDKMNYINSRFITRQEMGELNFGGKRDEKSSCI